MDLKKSSKIIAIIPARGGSKRIPNKNIKNFCGKPIIAYSIGAAIQSKCFDRVIVSTDTLDIAKVAKRYKAEVPFLRSSKNSSANATITDVILEVVARMKQEGSCPEYCCLIYATAPTISAEDIKKALGILKKTDADVVIPVVEYEYPVGRALKISKNYLGFVDKKNAFRRSQDLSVYYHDSGLFSFFKTNSFIKQKAIFMQKAVPLKINRLMAQDIDTSNDWLLAEAKYRRVKKNEK